MIGYHRFTYSKEKVEMIKGFLDANENSVSKAFDCVWHDPLFSEYTRDDAACLVNLIDRIARQEPNETWDHWTSNQEEIKIEHR
jgi:hypothetical protein